MNRIAYLISSGEEPGSGDREALEGLVERSPWFAAGRSLLVRIDRAEGNAAGLRRHIDALAPRLAYYPPPGFMLEKVDGAAFRRVGRMNIVEDFLSAQSHRIAVDEERMAAVQEDISLGSLAAPDDMATETLAEVYLSQGLVDRALDTYRKLSLKYPEKSIYFAAIIRDLEIKHKP